MKNFLSKLSSATLIFSMTFAMGIGLAAHASTITTINGTDTLTSSRTVINTNFSNLNTDKLQSASYGATLNIGTLSANILTATSTTASSTIAAGLTVAGFANSNISSSGLLVGTSAGGYQVGVIVGSGLSLSGGTLSTSGSGITALGPVGQTQTGGTQTLATSTSAYAGLTSAITIVGSGNTQTFTPSLSGTLTVAGGGTGAATLTGLVVGNGTSAMTAYAGATCTNQFIRVLSAAGAATCATVGAADVSLANLSATDSTLTFSGTYTGATARTIGINLGNANAWTALQNFANASTSIYSNTKTAYFGGTATTTINADGLGSITMPTSATLTTTSASTTNTTVSGELVIPNGTSKGSTVAGQTELDTTDNQLKIGDGTNTNVFDPRTLYSFGYATSTAFTGSTTALTLAPFPIGFTIKNVRCTTDVGTLDMDWYYGPTPTHLRMLVASTTPSINAFTTNNTPGANASSTVVFGTPASSPTTIGCTAVLNTTGT